jgi:class 3 adenylate cyclase
MDEHPAHPPVEAFDRFPDENPNPVLRIGLDGHLLYANPAAAAIVESLGTDVGGSVAPAWLATTLARARAGTTVEVVSGLHTFELRPVEVAALGFLNVYGTDITARRAIVKFPDQNPHPVFRINWDGELEYANGASADLIDGLGCSVGRPLDGELFDRLATAVRAGNGASIELSSKGREYELLPVEVPEFGFINVYGTDVTAERQLLRLHRENERLLLNILPEEIAERLRRGETVIADRFDDVTLLFADIVGFTEMSSTMSATELVSVLNEVFTAFDDLVDRYELDKVKTIGDAYMVIGGLLDDATDHTERVADLALALAERLDAIEAATRLGVRFRIGINCGPVVAGVIGTKKFIYDVWGDTVNVAARMESLGIPGRIQVSGAVEERLRGRYELEARGLIEVKGKGSLPAWFLLGGPGISPASGAGGPRDRRHR